MVVVGKDGELIADSDPSQAGRGTSRAGPSSAPRSRARRPAAPATRTRSDETLQYFAVPIVHANAPIGALRVTYPTSFVDARIRRTWFVLAAVGAVILGIVFLVSLRLARQVTKPLDELERAAARLGAGDLEARAPVPDGPPEIRALAESFNRTAARLEELVTSQQAFVADASHQLRTPLAALRLRLENLEGELADAPDVRARGRRAARSTEVARLSRLVDGLLELARAERSARAAEPIDLGALVRGRVDAWSALAAERDVEPGRPRSSPTRRALGARPPRAGARQPAGQRARRRAAGRPRCGSRPAAAPGGSSSRCSTPGRG